jgi:NAD(P)-dependent dehydrogenase (short-subunit alcohol dehydrogenase family)
VEFGGRTAVVTGGASGIGRGLALALAQAGANVVVADIELAGATAVAEEARSAGVESLPVRVDVASLDDVAHLRTLARRRFGQVHILCNNAGVSVRTRGIDATHADWEWLIGVNLWGVIHGMETFLPDMVTSGEQCHVVNTASMHGFVPSARSAMYSATKYAVVGLSDTYRSELARTNVGISVLCPAAVTSRIEDAERNRPRDLRNPGQPAPFTPTLQYDLSAPRDPLDVGRLVLDGIRQSRRYIFTDTKILPYIERRHRQVLEDFELIKDS